MKKNTKYRRYTNKNARIQQARIGSRIETETQYRDDDFRVAATRFPDGTQLVQVGDGDQMMSLTGSQARTLYRVLDRHYSAQNTDATYQKLQLTLGFE